MSQDFLNVFPISASANHADGSFIVSIKPFEIKGDNIGLNNNIEKESLKGNFRLMNGSIYRVINDEPPVSDLLKLSEQINLKDARANS